MKKIIILFILSVSLLTSLQGSDAFVVGDSLKIRKKEEHRNWIFQQKNKILELRSQRKAYSDSLVLAHRSEQHQGRPMRKPGTIGFNSALSVETSQGGLIGQRDFFLGMNSEITPIRFTASYDLKYSFSVPDFTLESQVFGSPYQGIGARYMTFNNRSELGTPWGVYLFQGARIASISSRVSLDYEWNFGITSGWKSYDYTQNPYNDIVGSKNNAYLGLSVFGKWMISRHFDLKFGVVAAHYSNGNTTTPNEGINTLAAVVGIKYYFNRDNYFYIKDKSLDVPKYPRHLEHELLFHGGFKGCSVDMWELPEAADRAFRNKKFATFGITYAPMFAVGYKFRVGPSLDILYDETSGMQYSYDGYKVRFHRAAFNEQMSLGLAAKGDFVMPYFTLSLSLGYDVISQKSTQDRFYQILALKMNITRDIFLNVGYKAIKFSTPSNLMLGIGVRFNKYR